MIRIQRMVEKIEILVNNNNNNNNNNKLSVLQQQYLYQYWRLFSFLMLIKSNGLELS